MKEKLWLSLLSGTTVFFGFIYSLYHTDPHHWGFIAGTALDYIHGKHLFTGTYIQYGIGEPLLFDVLHYFFPINYATTGFITAIVYALELSVIYLGVKKLSNVTIAVLLSATAVLLHTYVIYPWPDYYAGACLALACYSLIGHRDKSYFRHAIAGAFLFAAVIFRSTYLINISAGMVAYCVLALFNKKIRDRGLLICFFIFFILCVILFGLLYLQGDFTNWYSQSLGSGFSAYGINTDAIFKLLKSALLPPLRPSLLVTATFSALFYTSFIGLSKLLFKTNPSENKNATNGMLVFFVTTGWAGLAQCAQFYEIFRLQNACIPLYFALAIIIEPNWSSYKEKLRQRWPVILLATYFILMIVKVPHASSYFPLYDGDFWSYEKTDIRFFGSHRFRPEEKAYYESLAKFLCDGKRKIVNLTVDSTIPYLCEGQENALAIPFFDQQLLAIITPDKLNKVLSGEFEPDETIVTGLLPPNSPKIKLIKVGEAQSPGSTRYFGQKQIVSVYRIETPINFELLQK